MTIPRRKKYPPGPRKPIGKIWCSECQKIGWWSRRDARHAEHQYPEEQMRAYRCPATTTETLWHIGHLPAQVRQGLISADEWYGRTGEPMRCTRHSKINCNYGSCVAERDRRTGTSSSNDNSGQIGMNTDGHLTYGLGSGLTMDMSDGSLGISTGGGFSIDTDSSSSGGGCD